MDAVTTFCLILVTFTANIRGTAQEDSGGGDRETTPMLDRELRPINNYLTIEDEYKVIQNYICRGWPCPMFRVEEDATRLIQHRLYNEQEIISVTNTTCDGNFTTVLRNSYRKLYHYRRGNNEGNHSVQMSTPVVMEVSRKTTEDNSQPCTTYKLWIYNINGTADGTRPLPEPKDPDVKIENLEALSVYVKTFRSLKDKNEQYEMLRNDLEKEVKPKKCYRKNHILVAMYDPPWKVNGRRIEIWLIAKPCED